MLKEKIFLGKYVKLVKNDGFILHGNIIDIDENGLILSTDQKEGWHSFNNIRELTLDE